MPVFQLLVEGDRWVGEADTIFAARRACEVLILEDGEDDARIEVDGAWVESVHANEHGDLIWQTSNLVRQYDGRAR